MKLKERVSKLVQEMAIRIPTNPGGLLVKIIFLYWLFRQHGKIRVTQTGRVYIPHRSTNIIYAIPVPCIVRI